LPPRTRRDNFLKTLGFRQQVPFFAALGPSAIADVTHMLRTMDLPPRTMIIRKARPAMHVFIAAGEVEVDLPGKKVRLSEGAFFARWRCSAIICAPPISPHQAVEAAGARSRRLPPADGAASRSRETIDVEAKRRALENK